MTPQLTDADLLLDSEGQGFATVEVDDPARDDPVTTWRAVLTRSGRWRMVLIITGALLVILAAVVWATSGAPSQAPSHTSAARLAAPPLTTIPGVGSASGDGAIFGSSSQQSAGTASAATGSSSPAGSQSSPSATGNGLPDEVPTFSSKVVKTGTLQLQVATGSVPSAVGRLTSEASGLGGFVASSTESTGGSASGDMTLRVPVANFNALIADAQRLGKTIQLTSTGQDVTSQYVDLQARIDSLQTARTQFEQILAKAQTIGDILAVESQISDLQTQIEQLQGQFQVLDNQATYSTLTVHLDEATKPAPAPPKPEAQSGISKAWSHARHSFAHGAESILAASGGVTLFIVTVLIVLAVGWGVWTGTRRRARQPAAADRA